MFVYSIYTSRLRKNSRNNEKGKTQNVKNNKLKPCRARIILILYQIGTLTGYGVVLSSQLETFSVGTDLENDFVTLIILQNADYELLWIFLLNQVN